MPGRRKETEGEMMPGKEQLNAIMKAMGYHTEIRADREED